MKAGLAVVVIAFGLVVLFNAPGVIGAFFGGIGQAVGGVVDKLSQTAAPSPTELVLPPAPGLTVPTQPYTNQPTLDLTGTIPNSVAGQPGYTIRIYRKVGTAAPTRVAELPVGDSPTFTARPSPSSPAVMPSRPPWSVLRAKVPRRLPSPTSSTSRSPRS